jgi:hypothetical protein
VQASGYDAPHQPEVRGVDFVTVFVASFGAAAEFYESTLGPSCSVRYDRVPGPSSRPGI